METGFVGEYYVYYLDNGQKLLVAPDDEITPNFEHFKKSVKDFSDKTFRGLRSIVLKDNEELLPVKIKNSEGYYEGLYFLIDKK